MDFPERLKELRTKKRLSQGELGRFFNLSKQSISAYENGDSSPPADTLVLIADYFGVTTDYLMGRVPPDNIVDLLEGDDREKVLEYARLLLDNKKNPADIQANSGGLTPTGKNGNDLKFKKEKRRKKEA